MSRSTVIASLITMTAWTMPQIAYAQAAEGPAGPEVIVVTATKRSEQVDKVAISIAATSQLALEKEGVKTLSDLSAVTPGLIFSAQNYSGAPIFNFSIRGVQSKTSAPTTSVYLDDTALLSISENNNLGAGGTAPQAFDLDRVEVLRGPQGTLFGASSEGGSVRFITPTPSLTTFSGYGVAEGSKTSGGGLNGEVGAAVGGPLVDGKLGFRASASYSGESGYIDRVLPVIGKAGNGGVVVKDANSDNVVTARLALLAAPNSWLTIEPSIYYQRAHSNDTGRYEVAISNASAGSFNNASNTALPATDEFTVSALKIGVDLGSVALTSITSYFARDVGFQTDYQPYQDLAFLGNPYPTVAGETALGDYSVKQHTFSQELRAASADTNARISWIAGVYYSKAYQDDFSAVQHDSLKSFFPAGAFYQDKYVYWDDVVNNVRQISVFGNLDFRVTDTLKLSVGGRWSDTSSRTDNHLEGPFAGGHQVTGGRGDDRAFTPKVTLAWQKDSRNLFYVSAGKGFRPGGINTLTTNGQANCLAWQAANVTPKVAYEPDSLWSYEVGTKNRVLGDKLTIESSAFHIDWRNIQTLAGVGPCGFGAVFNLGSAKIDGFDISLHGQVTEQFKLGVDFGYIHGTYNESQLGIVSRGDQIGGPGGNGNPAMPPFTLTATAEYGIPVKGGRVYLWAQDVYRSKNNGPFSGLNPKNPTVFDPALVGDPATNTVNLRAGLSLDKIDLSVFVNNLFNSHPQLSRSHNFVGDTRDYAYTFRPFTVGIRGKISY